ncbi:MAG TPA: type 1 glutamine amidotransferase [Candidatus Saccharimonadales bacterium]|nr:type 1 glutamine amidotransferase [Candidatus Saccharimonadales bacterium]
MTPDVIIVQNSGYQLAGLLERVLKEHDTMYQAIDVSKGEHLPDLTGFRAVIILGGTGSANDANEIFQGEIAAIAQAVQAQIPLIAIGLGMHLLVKAARGTVVPSPVKEAGFIDAANVQYAVTLTAEGRQDPIFAGLSDTMQVFQNHIETVTLPAGAQLLATGKDVPNQIIKVGSNAYGFQPHFEMDDAMLQAWAELEPEIKPIGAPKLLDTFARQRGTYTVTGLTLFRNFLNAVNFF